MSEDSGEPRRQWTEGPSVDGAATPWLSLADDDLLNEIERLAADHQRDRDLLEIVRSDRHFFIRQEAAKRIHDAHRLKDHSGDRHIGQILVRGMTRAEDVAYLTRLMSETRHLEVRKAADAQLKLLLSEQPTALPAPEPPPTRRLG